MKLVLKRHIVLEVRKLVCNIFYASAQTSTKRSSKHSSGDPREGPGDKSRMFPPYPQRVVKGD